MKNIFVLLFLSLIACSPVRHELKTSTRRSYAPDSNGSAVATINAGESHAVSSAPVSASPVYASNKKIVIVKEDTPAVVTQPTATLVPDAKNESSEQKITAAQMEMFRQIEMDRQISFEALKKVMQRRVYTTEVRILNDSSSSSIVLSQDTVYATSHDNGKWYPVQ